MKITRDDLSKAIEELRSIERGENIRRARIAQKVLKDPDLIEFYIIKSLEKKNTEKNVSVEEKKLTFIQKCFKIFKA